MTPRRGTTSQVRVGIAPGCSNAMPARVNKVQLLLDATLDLINIEQNNTVKVLTIVSVVGILPTLIASMYSMNFKGMAEYDWSWGYPYGLAMIALSAILPLAWFKCRGWI